MSALDQNLKNAVSNLISLNYGSTLVPSEKFSDEKSDTKKDELDLNTIILPKLSEVSTAAMNFHQDTFVPMELPSSKDITSLSIEFKNALKHPFIGCLPVAPNNGELIDTLDKLEEKKINYADILSKNGLNQIKDTITLDFSKFESSIREMMGAPPVLSDLSRDQKERNDLNIVIDTNTEITQSWTLMDIVNKKPPQGWLHIFKESYNDLIRINDFLIETEKISMWYPLKKHLFAALDLTPLDEVKVVIIGQDPYPGTNKNTGNPIADGKSFSTDRSNPIPQSLSNVFKILVKTIPGYNYPAHGDLTCWCRQGVLLLNSCLTLDPGSPGSHKNLWGEFITRIIKHIDKVNPKCVYLLWGNHAQEIGKLTSSKNVLMTSHPSNQGMRFGFVNCNHFNECNQILIADGKTPIDWNVY